MMNREMADATQRREGDKTEERGMKIPDRPNARDVLDELFKAAKKVAMKNDAPSQV